MEGSLQEQWKALRKRHVDANVWQSSIEHTKASVFMSFEDELKHDEAWYAKRAEERANAQLDTLEALMIKLIDRLSTLEGYSTTIFESRKAFTTRGRALVMKLFWEECKELSEESSDTDIGALEKQHNADSAAFEQIMRIFGTEKE